MATRNGHDKVGVKQVGIWIRVLTEDQTRGASPEHQGWRVREVYDLEAVSGKSVMGHPEAERILEENWDTSWRSSSPISRDSPGTPKNFPSSADLFWEHDPALNRSRGRLTPPRG